MTLFVATLQHDMLIQHSVAVSCSHYYFFVYLQTTILICKSVQTFFLFQEWYMGLSTVFCLTSVKNLYIIMWQTVCHAIGHGKIGRDYYLCIMTCTPTCEEVNTTAADSQLTHYIRNVCKHPAWISTHSYSPRNITINFYNIKAHTCSYKTLTLSVVSWTRPLPQQHWMYCITSMRSETTLSDGRLMTAFRWK